jgi:predicted deacylase
MGEMVAPGDLAGTIWPVTGLAQPGAEIRFGRGGLIVAERHRPLVEPGDLLFRLGAEIDPEAMVEG